MTYALYAEVRGKKMKRLCDTGRGKKYKDPAEVFKVGLENVCQINNVK